MNKANPVTVEQQVGDAAETEVFASGTSWRRWLVIGAVALAAALLLWWLLSRGVEQARYTTVEVERRDLAITVTATGNLQPTRQVEVGSETSGLVAVVFVDNNDRVTRGQPLARLDTARLNDSLQQARAAVATAEAQARSGQASLDLTRSQLTRLEEVARLSDGRVPSAVELDQARAELRRAEAQLALNRASIAQARAQLSSAQTALARATIYSPVDGVVLSRMVDPGQTVAASFQTPVLFTIAEDLSTMVLDVKVDEADIARVAAGQQASFSVDAFPGQRFPARVERVDLGAATGATTTTSTTGSGVVSYTARLALANSEGRLRPGMTAVATINSRRIENAMVVPLSALRFSPPEPEGPNRLTVRPPNENRSSVQQSQIGIGSRQRIHVLQDEGTLLAIPVTTVAIVGGDVAVSGNGVRIGQSVVTSLREANE